MQRIHTLPGHTDLIQGLTFLRPLRQQTSFSSYFVFGFLSHTHHYLDTILSLSQLGVISRAYGFPSGPAAPPAETVAGAEWVQYSGIGSFQLFREHPLQNRFQRTSEKVDNFFDSMLLGTGYSNLHPKSSVWESSALSGALSLSHPSQQSPMANGFLVIFVLIGCWCDLDMMQGLSVHFQDLPSWPASPQPLHQFWGVFWNSCSLPGFLKLCHFSSHIVWPLIHLSSVLGDWHPVEL